MFMKKIGILLSSPKDIGGIFQYSLSIINSLKNFKKKKIYKIQYFYTDKIWEEYIPKNSKKIFIKKKLHNKFLRKIINFSFDDSLKFYKKNEFLNEEVVSINKSDCDLVIYPSQNIVSYLTNKKSLSTIHDLMHKYESHFDEYDVNTIKNRDLHYQSICNKCDGILVDSKLGQNHVLDSYKVKKNQLHILPFVVPKYILKRTKLNIKKIFKIKKKYFFYPAQFWEHKNHINVVEAFSYLQKENNDFVLVFCGAKKNFFRKVKDKVEEKRLLKHILFLGRVDDKFMRPLYENAELTIFASSCGPTNIPPLEALSVGSPLICSNAYSMPLQVKNSALFFDPNNSRDLFKKIKILIRNKKLKIKIIKEGKKTIKKYNQIHFNKLLNSYIKKILN